MSIACTDPEYLSASQALHFFGFLTFHQIWNEVIITELKQMIFAKQLDWNTAKTALQDFCCASSRQIGGLKNLCFNNSSLFGCEKIVRIMKHLQFPFFIFDFYTNMNFSLKTRFQTQSLTLCWLCVVGLGSVLTNTRLMISPQATSCTTFILPFNEGAITGFKKT